jgi:uncharacterized protein with HEPN domain
MKSEKLILNSIQYIFEYIKEFDLNGFKKNRKTYQAVIKELGIIGSILENSYLRKTYVELDLFVYLKYKFIFEYYQLDFENIWFVINNDLLYLKKIIKENLKEIN